MPEGAYIGTLHIEELQLTTIIGTYPHERLHPQNLYLSLVLTIEADGACRRDELSGTLDYEQLCTRLCQQAARSRYQLIERLAADLLELVLGEPCVRHATLRLSKPAAIPLARTIAFELSGGLASDVPPRLASPNAPPESRPHRSG